MNRVSKKYRSPLSCRWPVTARVAAGLIVLLIFFPEVYGQTDKVTEADIYEIVPVTVPDSVILEAGGLAFNDDGELAVVTRRGELWLIGNPSGENPRFRRYGRGLHEPLGLAFRDGGYYTAQRGELTKLEDRNNDGKADLYTTIYRWPLSGNYHEYSYGPKFLPNGEMIVTLNLSWVGHGASLVKWRGWMLKITEEGEMTPVATGMRSPNGFGINEEGDIFYSENQGDWIGSGWMTHLETGDFAGHPAGLVWSDLPESPLDLRVEDIDDSRGLTLHEQAENIPELKNPAAWFPHTVMGISTSDVLFITNEDQVGPYTGQALVADQGHSKIMRVALEKVDGEYQGAVFGFREGFSSGITKLEWGPDDQLYVGMTNRGWASTGEAPYGIDRMKWTGKLPFEMRHITAHSNGFTIEFTKPVQGDKAEQPDNYRITDFAYNYDRSYGSPVIRREERQVVRAELSGDKTAVRLYVEGLREGYICEIQAGEVRSAEGETLLHPEAYYTLNRIPDGPRAVPSGAENPVPGVAQQETAASPKRATALPPGWQKEVLRSIRIGTRPGLRFDRDTIRVKTGEKIALTFSNEDDMIHNMVITEPGAANRVGRAAMNLGLDGEAMAYVPETNDVLFHTSLLGPGDEETIYLEVPAEPGDYEFVCTFPGHHITMRGVLRVTER